MLAISVQAPRQLRAYQVQPPGTPGADEVEVRVERAGICGSDLHILHGSNPFARYPRIIGHEFAGTVVAVGSAAAELQPGDRVVVDPVVSCGLCYPCRIGRANVCARLEVFGVHRDGGFRDRLLIPAANCIKVPPSLPIEIAALAEPFSIAANVLSRTGISAQDTVLIYGAGTVGLTVLQVAKLHGARCVLVDVDPKRLARGQAFGADELIDPKARPVPEAVRAENDGLGPTVVIDGAGVPALLDEACRVASPAGRIAVLGFSAAPAPVSQQEIVRKELTIVGSRLSRKLLPQVVAWLAEGKLRPAAMILHTFPAGEAAAAFRLIEMQPQDTLKVQLAFDA